MKKYQKEVDKFVQQFDPAYWKPHETLARLVEEVGELAREINHKFGPKKKKATEKDNELEDELADILFTLICIANSLDIDLDAGFKRVMDKAYGRDGDRYKKKEKNDKA